MRLRAESLSKSLRLQRILEDLSFDWTGPGVLAVLGENGAGKSTLLRIIAGVSNADKGSLWLDDDALSGGNHLVRRRIGYVPDTSDPFPHLTVDEFLTLTSVLKAVASPDHEWMGPLGVKPLLRQKMGALSFGQRRKVCLVAALIGQPDLLVLDEPTDGLDANAVSALESLLEIHIEAGRAAIVATHQTEWVRRWATQSLMLPRGEVVDVQ